MMQRSGYGLCLLPATYIQQPRSTWDCRDLMNGSLGAVNGLRDLETCDTLRDTLEILTFNGFDWREIYKKTMKTPIFDRKTYGFL